MPGQSVIKTCGHMVRELGVHARRLAQRGRRPRLIVLPSGGQRGASRLRGWLIGQTLQQLGWRVVVMPPQLTLTQRLRILRMEQPDVILMQQARHPLNRPEYCLGVPYIFDIDDADYVNPQLTEAVTRCVQQAACVSAGSEVLADWCRQYSDEIRVVWTSTPKPEHRSVTPQKQRGPVISWAQSDPMGYRDEAAFVRDVALELSKRRTFELLFFGVTNHPVFEDFIKPLREAGVAVHAYGYLEYETYLAKNAEAAVGLNPIDLNKPFNRGKSFGKVLAYLHAETVTIASPLLEMPHFFTDGVNGRLVKNDRDAWVQAIEEMLDDPDRRQRMADAAYERFLDRLTTDIISMQYDQLLRRIIESSSAKIA